MYDLTDERRVTRELQRYLSELSYATAELPHIAVDGILGEETRQALSRFQERNGLPATGQADPRTWAEIYRQFCAAREARTARPILLPAESLPLALHARGSEVMLLQAVLTALREIIQDIPPLGQNGHFDTETQRALRAYQAHRRLPPSGILDGETWAVLAADYQDRAAIPRHAG